MIGEISGRDVGKALPAALEDGDAGFAIVFAGKDLAIQRTAWWTVGCGGVGQGLFVQEGIKSLEFMGGQDGGGFGVGASEPGQPEQTPGNDGKQGIMGRRRWLEASCAASMRQAPTGRGGGAV